MECQKLIECYISTVPVFRLNPCVISLVEACIRSTVALQNYTVELTDTNKRVNSVEVLTIARHISKPQTQ